jgi:hypothetical protein
VHSVSRCAPGGCNTRYRITDLNGEIRALFVRAGDANEFPEAASKWKAPHENQKEARHDSDRVQHHTPSRVGYVEHAPPALLDTSDSRTVTKRRNLRRRSTWQSHTKTNERPSAGQAILRVFMAANVSAVHDVAQLGVSRAEPCPPPQNSQNRKEPPAAASRAERRGAA